MQKLMPRSLGCGSMLDPKRLFLGGLNHAKFGRLSHVKFGRSVERYQGRG